jgi:hypothetical protein
MLKLAIVFLIIAGVLRVLSWWSERQGDQPRERRAAGSAVRAEGLL